MYKWAIRKRKPGPPDSCTGTTTRLSEFRRYRDSIYEARKTQAKTTVNGRTTIGGRSRVTPAQPLWPGRARWSCLPFAPLYSGVWSACGFGEQDPEGGQVPLRKNASVRGCALPLNKLDAQDRRTGSIYTCGYSVRYLYGSADRTLNLDQFQHIQERSYGKHIFKWQFESLARCTWGHHLTGPRG